LNKGQSFILDASIDREWINLRESVTKEDYQFFIISLDISKNFLIKLYKAKHYEESLSKIDELYNDHEEFLINYINDIALHITDRTFKQRLGLSENKFKEFLNS
jgi:hypothetical protein